MNRIENLSRFFLKKAKTKHEQIEIHNLLKIELLLPFTGCRKVLGKMPAVIEKYLWLSFCVIGINLG